MSENSAEPITPLGNRRVFLGACEREATECTMRAFLVVELPPMSTDLANLEFTADEMRRMGYATIELARRWAGKS